MAGTITSAIEGRLTDWRGLPPDATLPSVVQAVEPVRRVRDAGTVERKHKPFFVAAVEREHPPYQMQVWMREGEVRVGVIECDDPPIANLKETLASLGNPEWVLEDQRFHPHGLVTEYIYASRGLTLSILRPDEWSNEASLRAVHLQLYGPATTQHYLDTIGADASLEPAGDAVAALREAIAGRFARWRGLTGAETVDTVLQAAGPGASAASPVEAERIGKRFTLAAVERGEAPQRVEAWTLYGQDHVTLVEFADPVIAGLAETLRTLGAPVYVAQSETRFAEGGVVFDHVFAGRGLTLSIAEPYVGSSYPRRAVWAQLYRAASAEYYRRYIGPGPELRPYPRSG